MTFCQTSSFSNQIPRSHRDVSSLVPYLGYQVHQFFEISLESVKINPYYFFSISYYSVQFSSVAQSCPTLCDPINHSTPGLPVHHQLPESTQTHVHRVSDAIQPSHPLLSPCPPAFNLSQHQGLFFFFFSGSFQMSQLSASGGQSIGVSPSTSVPPMNTRTDLYYSGPHYFYIALLK